MSLGNYQQRHNRLLRGVSLSSEYREKLFPALIAGLMIFLLKHSKKTWALQLFPAKSSSLNKLDMEFFGGFLLAGGGGLLT